MFDSEQVITKPIKTTQGEEEFQIRFISAEKAGILTTRSEQSYFILDSADYWYDLIQEKYPAKRKCKCGHDFFQVSFAYTTRAGTDDYKSVDIMTCCTGCGLKRNMSSIDIDYSPTKQLFEEPIIPCRQPKIQYRVSKICKSLDKEHYKILIDYLSALGLFMYVWYFDSDKKRYVKQFKREELQDFLFATPEKYIRYLKIYFSTIPLNSLLEGSVHDCMGISISPDIWRKKEVIELSSPFIFAGVGFNDLYYINFCNEYIEQGCIISKGGEFCKIADQVNDYLKRM